MTYRKPDGAKKLSRQLSKIINRFTDPRSKPGKRAKAEILKAAEAYQEDRRSQITLYRKGQASQILQDLLDSLIKADEAVRKLSNCQAAYMALAREYYGDTHWQPADFGDEDDEGLPESGLIVYEPTRSVRCDVADLLRATQEVYQRWKKQPGIPTDHYRTILVSELMRIGREYLDIEPSDTFDKPGGTFTETNNPCAWFIREVFSLLGPHYGLPQVPEDFRYWLKPALRHLDNPRGNKLS